MTDYSGKIKAPHNVILEDRKKLSLTGVTDVDSFDETAIVAYTDYGELTIGGTELHISKLNIEEGLLSVEGNISSMLYNERTVKAEGFFSRVFR